MRAWQIALVGVVALFAIAFLPTYQHILVGAVAVLIVGVVLFGFLLRPHPEVLCLRTTFYSNDREGRPFVEHEQIAIKAEICRLWILFVPTFGAVAFLLALSAHGGAFMDYGWEGIVAALMSPAYWILSAVVITVISAWVTECWTLHNAKATSASQIHYSGARVSYYFVDADGEYFGGTALTLYQPRPAQLAGIVLYRADRPQVNRIATACLFHRMLILGHGLTDLDEETVTSRLASLRPRAEVQG